MQRKNNLLRIYNGMEGERKGQQLLEPLTDTEGCTVPFGEHSRSIDLRQLPSLPVSRHRAIAAGLDDPLDSDYGSAWDFTKLQNQATLNHPRLARQKS